MGARQHPLQVLLSTVEPRDELNRILLELDLSCGTVQHARILQTLEEVSVRLRPLLELLADPLEELDQRESEAIMLNLAETIRHMETLPPTVGGQVKAALREVLGRELKNRLTSLESLR